VLIALSKHQLAEHFVTKSR